MQVSASASREQTTFTFYAQISERERGEVSKPPPKKFILLRVEREQMLAHNDRRDSLDMLRSFLCPCCYAK